MRVVYTAVLIVFVAAVLVFCVQNAGTVEVSYLGWGMTLPMPVLVVLVYLAGMLTGWSLLSFLRRSLRGATQSRDPGRLPQARSSSEARPSDPAPR